MDLHLVLASLKFGRTPKKQKTWCSKKYEAWGKCKVFGRVIWNGKPHTATVRNMQSDTWL
jgi:hypothetical protein